MTQKFCGVCWCWAAGKRFFLGSTPTQQFAVHPPAETPREIRNDSTTQCQWGGGRGLMFCNLPRQRHATPPWASPRALSSAYYNPRKLPIFAPMVGMEERPKTLPLGSPRARGNVKSGRQCHWKALIIGVGGSLLREQKKEVGFGTGPVSLARPAFLTKKLDLACRIRPHTLSLTAGSWSDPRNRCLFFLV